MPAGHDPIEASEIPAPGGRSRATRRVVGTLAALCLALGAPAAPAEGIPSGDQFRDKLMRLGSGPAGGSFGPIADELCETLNRNRPSSLVRCVTVASAGSVFNIHAVANGSLELGFGQEDLVAQVAKDPTVKGGKALRVVAVMHESPIGIMVRAETGITDLRDIRRAVVNRGNRGSGIHANTQDVLEALGVDDKELKGVAFLPPSAFVKDFCEGRIDLIVNAIAQPSAQYAQLRSCGGEFLDIPEPVMKTMMEKNPWLRPMRIPAGLYDARQREVNTLGMRNLLFTRDSVDPEAVYRVAGQLTRELERMKKAQPYMASIRRTTETSVGHLPAPVHPGALRAMREATP